MTNRMHELLSKFIGRDVELTLLCGREVDGNLKALDNGIAVLLAPKSNETYARVGMTSARLRLSSPTDDRELYVRIDQVAVVDPRIGEETSSPPIGTAS